MSRSRAFNRSSRFNAKRRRRNLREVIPFLQEDSKGVGKPFDHSQELIEKTTQREVLADLLDSQ